MDKDDGHNTGGLNSFKVVDLKLGEAHVALEPTLITTQLGHSVSICLYSPRHMVGAMSHSLLPSPMDLQCANEARFVECAIKDMLDMIRRAGIHTHELVAKLFGGAETSRTGQSRAVERLYGAKTAEAARSCLESEGISVASECVGGSAGRKIIFNTVTGVVLVRKVGCMLDTELPDQCGAKAA